MSVSRKSTVRDRLSDRPRSLSLIPGPALGRSEALGTVSVRSAEQSGQNRLSTFSVDAPAEGLWRRSWFQGDKAAQHLSTTLVLPAEETTSTTSLNFDFQDGGAAATAGPDGAETLADESTKLKALPLAMLTVGLCLCALTVSLDNTILATTTPKITSVFNSLDDVGWYFSSYLMTQTTLQPTFGKIYAHFNVKWTFLAALAVFEVGSVICALAVSSEMLIFGRLIAGTGAAGLLSGGMIIVGLSVVLKKRGLYIAALSSMAAVSNVAGPVLGGVLTDRLGWRWCFWINLPLGGAAFVAVVFTFKNSKPIIEHMTVIRRLAEIDVLGALLLIGGIVSLLLALNWGGTTRPWSDSSVWGCLLAFGLLIPVFCIVQWWRGDRGTIPPRLLLRQRTILASCVFSFFLAMATFVFAVYLPLYFQAVKGTTAEESGIHTIPYLASDTVSSVIVAGCVTLVGWYAPFMWIGSAVFAVGSAMLSTIQVSSDAAHLIGYQVLAGSGFGACVQIPFLAVQVVADEKDMPTCVALVTFFSLLGGAISVSVANSIFNNLLIKQISMNVSAMDPAAIIVAGATGIREVTLPDQLARVLEAYNMALTGAFALPIVAASIAFCVSVYMEWRSVKEKTAPSG